jgi:DDE domain
VQRFTPLLIDAATPCRHAAGDRWFVDETYVKVAGRWTYLYRAIDQYGQVIDVLVAEKRDLAATRRFFSRALEHGPQPTLWGFKSRPTPLDLVICVFSSQGMIVCCGVASALLDLPPPSESVDIARSLVGV